MRREHVTTSFGEKTTVCRDDDGNFACPVCGFFDPQTANSTAESFLSSIELCPDCSTEIGNEDVYAISEIPIEERWAQLRTTWLDGIGWDKDAVDRIRTNLGIDVRRD